MDNGDGTWTLEEGDLDGLTVTPPTDSDIDFDLSVSVTSTEASTGETSTVESTFTVEVDAVADPTTVSATFEANIVEGGTSTETVTGDGSIDASNFNQPGQGFTVSARTLNADGSLSDASTDNVTSQSGGLGVKGSASDGEPDAQLGFNPETETSEQLVIDFDHDVTDLSFTVSRLFSDEGDSRGDAAGNEQGKWQVFDDGELVAEGTFDNESGNEGTFSIDLPDGVSFNQIVFSATEYSGGDGDQTHDSSDYFIKEIDFGYEDTVVVEETEPQCEVTVNVDATFGDFTGGSENHFIVVEVPEGWEPQGEYVEVDSSNYGEGTYIAIPVDAADLQETGGSISVPVTFISPVPEDDGSVSVNVFAVAQEVNIDGTVGNGEITLDNNNTMSQASILVDHKDMTPEPPELAADDAQGYEDTAIPLNIDAGLTDTDGSETLSVTISGVPEGATLSAGTDNGDGTWTLEESDLDGLSITPPTDSDVDFDLTVSATSTESATGETSTVESTFTVEVDAVADPTTVNATVETTLVEGEPATNTGDITVTNVGHEEAGFHNTYGYYIKDDDGNPTSGQIIFADTKDGIGDSFTIEDVDPDRVGFFLLPNGDNVNSGLQNGMEVNFEQDSNGTWHVVNAETGETLEGDGSWRQGGTQDSLFFSDNELNADGMDHVEDTGTVGNQNWEDLMKTALGQDNDYDDVNMQVDFTPDPGEATEPHCEVTVNVDATFGDYTDGSEGHYVFVEVPEGWTPLGEGVETVNNADYPQLPGGGNFVKVPVSAEALEQGDGAVTIEVQFEAPVDEAGADVQIDVFAGAVEENLSGDELTTDNNASFSGTSVTVEAHDLQVSPPDMDIDDAAGLEDTAIPLDMNISLTDTDGSESMSITISGVPNGASLSAGTDNGDGTWTLEEGDLDGLTITPPHDSDVDFDLTVDVAVTENATGETKTFSEDVKVEVVADADAPTLDASLSVNDDTGAASGDGGKTKHANNGFGNGDQTAPGNSNDHNNAENAGGDGTSANNDFVDSGGQNHSGTGGEPSSTTYDLDIDSALSDIDGSESLTITLGPVPEGVTFSAGTDNGDGTWSLEAEDLQDLQMTVDGDVSEGFDLPIKATSTEAENGDSESVDLSLKVDLPEDHGTPTETPGDPPVQHDGGTGHGSGHGSGAGNSGHGTGGASKVGKSGSGHGGHSRGGSGHGWGGHSKGGSGHGKGGHSRGGSGHGWGGHSKGGSGHGKGGHSRVGSGHGWGGHSKGGSGHGWGGHSGHGSGQGIAAAGGSGYGGPQGNNGFGNGDQDAPGGSSEHNNAENAGGGDGDRLMAALEKFSNHTPDTHDGGGDTFRNVGAGRSDGGDDGNWFDEQQAAPADDDVFGKTELERKEEEDQKAEEAQREEEEGGIQIPADDNSGPEADFEDRSLV